MQQLHAFPNYVLPYHFISVLKEIAAMIIYKNEKIYIYI
jgi:hypothetical protein